MLVCNYMYHREIALLSIAAKILVKILLNGLNEHLDKTGLWKIMAKFGCSISFVTMVRQFPDDMILRVQTH